MAWQKAGSVTLAVAGNTIDIVAHTPFTFNQFMFQSLTDTPTIRQKFRMNVDGGTNYSYRNSNGGGTDTTATNQTEGLISANGDDVEGFSINYYINIANAEKLIISFLTVQSGVGAGNAPNRDESVNKWVNTSLQETTLSGMNIVGSGDMAIGSNVSLLGTD